jgi:putative membrane protein
MYWGDMSWWGWLMMSVGMLVVYGLIVWGIARLLGGRDTAGAGRSSPEDVLGEWLARGEIDAWEYRGGVQALRSRGDRPLEPIS